MKFCKHGTFGRQKTMPQTHAISSTFHSQALTFALFAQQENGPQNSKDILNEAC